MQIKHKTTKKNNITHTSSSSYLVILFGMLNYLLDFQYFTNKLLAREIKKATLMKLQLTAT